MPPATPNPPYKLAAGAPTKPPAVRFVVALARPDRRIHKGTDGRAREGDGLLQVPESDGCR